MVVVPVPQPEERSWSAAHGSDEAADDADEVASEVRLWCLLGSARVMNMLSMQRNGWEASMVQLHDHTC